MSATVSGRSASPMAAHHTRVDVFETSLHDLEKRCPEFDAQSVVISSIDLTHILSGGYSHFGTGQVNFSLRSEDVADSWLCEDGAGEDQGSEGERVLHWINSCASPARAPETAISAQGSGSSLHPSSSFSTKLVRPSLSEPALARSHSARRVDSDAAARGDVSISASQTSCSIGASTGHSKNHSEGSLPGPIDQGNESSQRWSSVSARSSNSSSNSSSSSISSAPQMSPRSILPAPPGKDTGLAKGKDEKVVYWSVTPGARTPRPGHAPQIDSIPVYDSPASVHTVSYDSAAGITNKEVPARPPAAPAPRHVSNKHDPTQKAVYWTVTPGAAGRTGPQGPAPRSSSQVAEHTNCGKGQSSPVHEASGASRLADRAGKEENHAKQAAVKGWRKMAFYRS